MDLAALSDFNLVASHGGFGRAHRASGRPKATLSRHVVALEESLGIRLLERSSRAFRLTDEGMALHARTHDLVGEIAQVARDLREGHGRPRGRLRVSCPVTFGHSAMGRLAAQFLRLHPEVQLEVTVDDREVDLVEEGYDAVIRVNPRPDSELVGRCFARDQLLLVAPPSLARPVCATASALPETVPAVVGVKAADLDTWTVTDGDTVSTFKRQAVLRLPTPLMVRDAVLSGVGAAILARDLVSSHLAEGRLLCWGSLPGRSVELWVLHTSRRLISGKVAAFVQFLGDSSRPTALQAAP